MQVHNQVLFSTFFDSLLQHGVKEIMPAPQPIPQQPVKSSALLSLGHDPMSQTLEVTYHNKSVYRYPGVSAAEHQTILAAPSKGRALNSLITRRKLVGTRIDKPQP
jgi:hypothetical protein